MSKQLMEEDPMKRKLNITTSSKILASAILISGFVALASHSALAAKRDASATPQVKQKEFDTPQQAADSLVQAAESFDVPVLKEILGPDSIDLVSSKDPVEDKNRAVAFAAKAKEKNSVATDPKNPNRAVLTIGNDDFPFPIPIVKQKGKWYFDAKAGRQEILNRRVGANELDAIAICRGFVEAQQEYAQEKHDDSKVNQYAQRIISTPGKHDGLAWQNSDGTWGGPVGEGIAKALEQGYTERSSAFSRLLFQSFERARSRCAFGPNGLCRGRSNDRRIRPCSSTGPVSGYGSADLHRWPQRSRVPKRSRARYPEEVSEHGPVQSR